MASHLEEMHQSLPCGGMVSSYIQIYIVCFEEKVIQRSKRRWQDESFWLTGQTQHRIVASGQNGGRPLLSSGLQWPRNRIYCFVDVRCSDNSVHNQYQCSTKASLSNPLGTFNNMFLFCCFREEDLVVAGLHPKLKFNKI